LKPVCDEKVVMLRELTCEICILPFVLQEKLLESRQHSGMLKKSKLNNGKFVCGFRIITEHLCGVRSRKS